MKTVKRLLICLTCLVVLLSSLPFSSSALEGPDYEPKFEYDEEGNVICEYYVDHPDYVPLFELEQEDDDFFDFDFGISLFAASKSHTSWTPSKIDWASFPSHIRNIAYSPYSNISFKDVGGGDFPNRDTYRAPLILITTDGTNYTIRAGWNVGLYYRASTGNCTFGYEVNDEADFQPVLYKATFKCSDNSVVSNWATVAADAWGNSGLLKNYPGSGFGVNDEVDIFTYGAVASDKFTTYASVRLTNDNESVTISPLNEGRGVLDHPYCGIPATMYNSAAFHISTFTPSNPNSYTVTDTTNFGLNSKILTGDYFIPADNLPYGLNSLVITYTINGKHSYSLITNASTEAIFLRSWVASEPDKFRMTLLSKSPIYRVAYNSTSGGYASMSGASGLVESDLSSSWSTGSTSWHKIIDYYVAKGYYYYSYATPAGDVGISISNNATKLKIDETLSFPHSFSGYPNANTLNQFIMEEQNALIEEGNETSNSIWTTLKEMFAKLKTLPTDIADNIKNFFTTLSDNISGFFTDIWNNLSTAFTNLTTSVSGFFTDLSNNIKGYFETLKNYLLYFDDEKPEHQNPYAGSISTLKSFFTKQISDIDDFESSLDVTLILCLDYINSGTTVIESFLSGVPIISTILTFFIAFCVVRKVIGR